MVAELDDGSRAEDVRFLNAPHYVDEVDVNLVELYTTVTDRSGQLVRDLTREDFEILEDGRPQEITKFELVDDLPLTVGIAIDTSGSMVAALPEAQQAALDFLRGIMKPRDRAFAAGLLRPALSADAADQRRQRPGERPHRSALGGLDHAARRRRHQLSTTSAASAAGAP